GSDDDESNPLANVALIIEVTRLQYGPFRMIVHVDKARRYSETIRINLPVSLQITTWSQIGNTTVINSEVEMPPRAPGTVNDESILDDDIKLLCAGAMKE